MSSGVWPDCQPILVDRVNQCLRALIGPITGNRLREAMSYSVFNGGKRLRPLLTYATGQCLGLPLDRLDPAAAAVELIHCYSLVHDDLPAMDDDDLRRGQPTTHLAYDEATAILAGDALQALAFEAIVDPASLRNAPEAVLRQTAELTQACGVDGMAGGQALDLQMEGARPSQAEVEHMLALKTGALIKASILMPWQLVREQHPEARQALSGFANAIGLAFQIRDDLLDIEGDPSITGKASGADQAHQKASWPAMFGVEVARRRLDELAAEAEDNLKQLSGDTSGLRWLADKLIQRES